ncbi:hypothetical protein ACFZAE_38745 [Streptomyces scabiei]|uniref:hypothetical protein n=1 Tax=Streptomyces TaxID=1883 RepID=UPI001BFF9CB0|nr:hypothetical protein [Streptomyces sp. ATCC 21386]
MTEDEVPIDDMSQARGAARAFSYGCGAARLGAAWQEILRTGLGLGGGSGTLPRAALSSGSDAGSIP